MTPLEECRAAFEQDCKVNEVYLARHFDHPEQYQLYETQLRWMGWQACWNRTSPPASNEGVIRELEAAIEKAICNAQPERIVVRQELRQRTGEPLEILNERIENRASPRHQASAVIDAM